MNRKFSGLQCFLSCSMLILCFALVANAQFKAVLQGTVSDSSGSSVVGANVVLTNSETNKELSTVSNSDGFYRFNGLAPGNYKLVVTQTNFKQYVVEKVEVGADGLQGLNVSLEAGGVSEIVTVTGREKLSKPKTRTLTIR